MFCWEIIKMYIIVSFIFKLCVLEMKMHNNDRCGLVRMYHRQSNIWFTEIQIMVDKRKNVMAVSDNEILSFSLEQMEIQWLETIQYAK